jgi:CheY-like chemotaxis protein
VVEPFVLGRGDPPHAELATGDWLVIRVTDDGTGIPSDVLSRIFEPFFTTKPRSEGTGLGLAQVHGIVADHGGYIDVQSEPGRGTTFQIYLPRRAVPDQAPDAPRLVGGASQGRAVLLVEDDPEVRRVTQAMLERSGYAVTAAAGAGEAIDLFTADPNRFRVAILDVVLPEIGGVELLQRLRAARPDLAVIVMSGYRFDDEVRELIDSGQVRSLQKPVHRADLVRAVEAVLARAPLPR